MEYFISDTHFSDPNILIYSRPNFKSIEEMNNLIVKNWNETVTNKDTVYILGDIGNLEYLNKLNGNKIIIIGNHDRYEEILDKYPDIKVYDKPIIEKWMILSHEPIVFLPKEAPFLNIHGHLHQFDYRYGTSLNWYDGNRYFNVSCEKINFTPISKEEIIKQIEYINI